ncbi:agmatinase [Candidatus Kaiserbacteria bacterium RIFCSPLOWO2_01_FULL_54_24]|uniref:Agmatinase n=1 Tax=Candidatus Kaiserbacteria bacterium RIFCSPLOWO2_01_FULL_54_24 TaxID=1798515 RepID=A0A1F6EVX5_9BACT|nr:MAG: agmatinase [Candidatus Kaiserbacteria bacterium RIFCSPLOWO2_01_FULL_54_24]
MKLSFGDFPKKYSDPKSARIAILPVPYDGTSTYGKGADKGPAALLAASFPLENYDIETKTEVYKHGIYVEKSVTEKRTPEKMAHAVEKRVAEVLAKNKYCVMLGGEHSVTPGAVRAHAKKYRDLTVLQLDAHTDMRDSYHGSKNNHACAMARVKEFNPVQVGIRSIDIGEMKNIRMDRVFFAKDIHATEAWMDKAISKLGKHVYLTIDLDVFDPALMPSTGTPEPGGLAWYPVLRFLKKVVAKRTVVGFDVVELLPRKDTPAPDFLAAKLVYTLLSYIFSK